MSKVKISGMILILIAISVSFTIGSWARHPKETVLLSCNQDTGVWGVAFLSPAALQTSACVIGEDCALCLDQCLADGYRIVHTSFFSQTETSSLTQWGFRLQR